MITGRYQVAVKTASPRATARGLPSTFSARSHAARARFDLARASRPLTQGYVGAAYSIWNVGLAAEYDIAEVNTFTFMIGFHPHAD